MGAVGRGNRIGGAGRIPLPAWLDRASVVRQGGLARDARLQRAGTAIAANSRLPSLWQAQIEQFAEQVAAAGDPSPPAKDLAGGFGRFLPPVGLLPKNALIPPRGAVISSPPASTSTPLQCPWSSWISRCVPTPHSRR